MKWGDFICRLKNFLINYLDLFKEVPFKKTVNILEKKSFRETLCTRESVSQVIDSTIKYLESAKKEAKDNIWYKSFYKELEDLEKKPDLCINDLKKLLSKFLKAAKDTDGNRIKKNENETSIIQVFGKKGLENLWKVYNLLKCEKISLHLDAAFNDLILIVEDQTRDLTMENLSKDKLIGILKSTKERIKTALTSIKSSKKMRSQRSN